MNIKNEGKKQKNITRVPKKFQCHKLNITSRQYTCAKLSNTRNKKQKKGGREGKLVLVVAIKAVINFENQGTINKIE
jgi:hypothetical protein